MLYLISTPIGNLEDISLRALRILKECDVILCEDTRRTGMLLKHFEIPPKPLLSYYDEVESQKLDDVLALIKSDQKVALVSDAGTPLINDPGYKLVRAAILEGVKVESIPGPNAAISALTISGLPPDKFLFLGYPPEKESHARDLLLKIKNIQEIQKMTVIFYVSPYKLQKFLKLFKELYAESDIVVVRELTKIYEEVWRGKPTDATIKFSKPRGEFVILFNG